MAVQAVYRTAQAALMPEWRGFLTVWNIWAEGHYHTHPWDYIFPDLSSSGLLGRQPGCKVSGFCPDYL